jgi:phage-related minor tail protein
MLPAQQAARVEVATDAARKAEREARVMQERWNDLKVELAKRGIPVSDH